MSVIAYLVALGASVWCFITAARTMNEGGDTLTGIVIMAASVALFINSLYHLAR